MTIHYDFDGEEYEFEPDNAELIEVIISLFSKEFEIDEDKSKNIISAFDLYDDLEEIYFEDIENRFEEEAKNEYLDNKEYRRNPLGYYGMSEKDFY